MRHVTTAGLSAAALTALPLSPIEGFVFSRVEGARCSEDDLVLATGLDEATVAAAVTRLVQFGALREVGAVGPSAGAAIASAAPKGLTEAERALVDRLESRRVGATHYELLGVPRDADRRTVKEAYYELVALLHPDAFVGRDLGPDASRITALFGAVEIAHDVLTHRERRAQYDADLAARGVPLPVSSGRGPVPLGSQSAMASPASEQEPITPQPISGHVLARKLGRSVPPPPLSSGRIAAAPASSPLSSSRLPTLPPPPGSGARDEDAVPSSPRLEAAAHAMAELRRRYEQLAPLARAEKLASLIAQGNEALHGGNGRAALQAFRLAQSLAPDDPSVVRGLVQAEALAAPEVAKGYAFFAKRAEYADQTTDARAFWEEAAQRAPDDAETQGRAAEALLRLEGDAGSALRIAGRAVLLEPKRADFHALLGRAYVRQGMLRNAEREAQAAEALDASCSELVDLRRELASRMPVG